MLKSDRFSCSKKIRLKWDPPYKNYDEELEGLYMEMAPEDQ